MSAVQADANKICDWRSEVLAAEAKRQEVPANAPDGYPGHRIIIVIVIIKCVLISVTLNVAEALYTVSSVH